MESYLVQTRCGTVSGVREGCIVFKGIPYARAPVGALRFRAPQPCEPWEGVRAADTWPRRSMQEGWDSPDGFFKREFYSIPGFETPASEDSLYLNIWTPRLGAQERMPVLFYIHGGGFVGGYGHEPEFCTDAYARRDVVLVTINYRLGIFGYLAHPWLTAEDPKASGGLATLDQIAALDWVRENIAGFGGNPDNITICGQSAGAISVQTLLASPLARGKFARAIIQSGTGYPNYLPNTLSLAQAEEMGQRAMGYGGIRSLEELRAAPVEQLFAAQGGVIGDAFRAGTGLPFAPVVNGHILTESVTEATAAGHMAGVPTVIGSTRNDITVTEEEAAAFGGRMHRSNVDYSLMCQRTQDNPAFVYYFQRQLPGDGAGAFHSSELWYTFGTLGRCWRPVTEGDHALSARMLDHWCGFAKTGDPGLPGAPWKPCTREEPFVMVFDAQ